MEQSQNAVNSYRHHNFHGCRHSSSSKWVFTRSPVSRSSEGRSNRPQSVQAGKSFSVVVAATIDVPYRIQGHPATESYIPTEMEIGPVKGFKIDKIVYPSRRKQAWAAKSSRSTRARFGSRPI